MIDPGLRGRAALVTGVNNPEGIGAAVARALAAQGARLFVTYLRAAQDGGGTPEAAPSLGRYSWLQTRGSEALSEEICSAGGEVASMEADLADPDATPQLFDGAEELLGAVDILVHSAAHWEPDTFLPEAEGSGQGLRIDAQGHDRHFAVNSRAAALLIAEFADRYVARKCDDGRIILISTDGARGHAGAVSYGASKLASESLARAAAWELGPQGITVNVVSPGPIQTGWITAGEEEELAGRIPMRRVGTPQDVADAVVFLASRQAGWITGQVLHVGGGNVMGG